MRTGLFQLLGQIDVVLEVELRPAAIEEIAGVAQRALAQRATLDHRIHRHPHVIDPVQ